MRSDGLKTSFTPLGIWIFSIGTSIGWGSFIVTCNTCLQKSGVLGTAFGLLIGMAVIPVITWNLQYMIRTVPNAGGIYTFEKRVGGKDLGFLATWFVLLTCLAILWTSIASVPLFARFFLGNTFQVGFHYRIFGYEVWFGEALLSIVAVLVIGLLCSQSSRLPNRVIRKDHARNFGKANLVRCVKHEGTIALSFKQETGAVLPADHQDAGERQPPHRHRREAGVARSTRWFCSERGCD